MGQSDHMIQHLLFGDAPTTRVVQPFKEQLLKWIGNKQRFAHEIASYFPECVGVYFEPFLGSGAVLGTLAPKKAVGSDAFAPLVDIWRTLRSSPDTVKGWYEERWERMMAGDKVLEFERVKAAYNAHPNGADLLFVCRTCYGGVVRFRKADGYCSTPCGVHSPMPPAKFTRRVDEWHKRTRGTTFECMDFEEAMDRAQPGDLVYCDPPYRHSQAILYGAQQFNLHRLLRAIEKCRRRGVHVALSIDGTKRTGKHICELPIPDGLFAREIYVNCGRSMLLRFQMADQSLENEVVHDRLLLTY
jgi:DNA adenine methylase